MKKFEFIQDVKLSVWERQKFVVEAETEEEAIEKAKKFKDVDVSAYEENFIDSETLYDTEELIHVSDNNGNATIEIYNIDNIRKPIATNAQ